MAFATMNYRIAIVGGGTLGHTSPGLAVAEVYRSRGPDCEPLFLGVEGGIEADAIRARGFGFAAIPAAPLLRASLAAKLRVGPALLRGFLRARPILQEARVVAVLGLGGYVSAAPLLAGRSLGLVTAVHESNARAGIANRVLSRLCDRVYLGFDSSARDFPARPPPRTVGNPVRSEVQSEVTGGARTRQPPVGRAWRVLVAGGSEGSDRLNRRMPDIFAGMTRAGFHFEIRHQTGARPPEVVRAAYQRAGLPADVTAFLDDVGAAYAWADLAVTPAGASTLAELAHAALPALVVPRGDVALDHQRQNARAHAEIAGAGLWVDPDRLDAPETVERLAGLLDPVAWQRASEAARRLARPEAAAAIVQDLDELCRSRLTR